jgi:hypothetical protein
VLAFSLTLLNSEQFAFHSQIVLCIDQFFPLGRTHNSLANNSKSATTEEMQSAATTLQVDNLSNPKLAYSNRCASYVCLFAQTAAFPWPAGSCLPYPLHNSAPKQICGAATMRHALR